MPAFEHQDVYEAVVAAFALISYADGEVHMSELARLMSIVTKDEHLSKITLEQVRDETFDLIRLLDKDFEQGRDKCLATIAKIKGDTDKTRLILSVARRTLIADERILPSEEAMLAEIHKTLGISE